MAFCASALGLLLKARNSAEPAVLRPAPRLKSQSAARKLLL
jgi:hypothetical protein